MKFIMILSVFWMVFSCEEAEVNMELNSFISKDPAVVTTEFVYSLEAAPTPQCHASTIAFSGNHLVAAWFGGTAEKNDDVGIWLAIRGENGWSRPAEIVNGIQEDGKRFPCWNPVLFQPEEGPLMLFYKVGPNPKEWWGMVTRSDDGGKSFSTPERLPDGYAGPIKNKPVQLGNGTLLSPSSTEDNGWRVHVEYSDAMGKKWRSSGPLNDGKAIGAIQPSVLFHPDNRLQMLCRGNHGKITQFWSEDGGQTWGIMQDTDLPNPNSGIDALTLQDGRHLLVYNPTGGEWGARVPLTVAISKDGIKWEDRMELEPLSDPKLADELEYSYPAVIQDKSGTIHIVYTWNRKTVKYIRLDGKKI